MLAILEAWNLRSGYQYNQVRALFWVSDYFLYPHMVNWKKSYDKPRQCIKSKDITLQTKVCIQSYVFPVVMYGCESWTINKVECWSTDAFKLWCWRRLESPLDFKEIKPVKGNQLWIFIERTDGEVLNTLATSCKEPTHWKRSWCWERLTANGEGGRRGCDGQIASLTQWTWIWANSRR